MDDNRDVEIRFPPVPGHVRTARLVAVAVARRVGLDDLRIDEVRLAVGEACARAVRRCILSGDPGPVVLVLSETENANGLQAEVWDDAHPTTTTTIGDAEPPPPGAAEPAESAAAGDVEGYAAGGADGEGWGEGRGEGREIDLRDEADEPDDSVVVALLAGLADRVELLEGPGGPGGRVRMTWTHHPNRGK